MLENKLSGFSYFYDKPSEGNFPLSEYKDPPITNVDFTLINFGERAYMKVQRDEISAG